MNILLIDVDSKIPNLALMKISTYHKNMGDSIYLNYCKDPDLVYISCIFSKNKNRVLELSKSFNCKVHVGGYGINDHKLSEKQEHIMPDYNLYNMDYSMGFTSRGCIRKCPWCIVPSMEGDIYHNADLEEFLYPNHNKLILLDNNFLASPDYINICKELIEKQIKISFNQGLDIRLINTENAKLLSKIKYYDYKFRSRRLYFAFDQPEYENEVLKGISILKKNGIRPHHMMFYILIGFNTCVSEDLHRIKLLKSLKVLPYVMVYNKKSKTIQTKMQRWVNRRYYNFIDWGDYHR